MAGNSNVQDLKNKPIKRLLWQYALPAIVGSSVNALYNIISRYFVGNASYLGDDAMSSLGVALPVMIIITAFGMLVGAGAASRISIYLGNNAYHKAEKTISNALILFLLITLPLTVLLLFFLKPIVVMLGAEGKTADYTYDFLLFFLPGSIFSTLCFGFTNMIRASGFPRKAMLILLMTLVVNALLSPLFIDTFKWGVKGAALSIVISMFCGAFFALQHFIRPSNTLRVRWQYRYLEWPIVKAILSIGMSPFLMQLVSSGVVFFIIKEIRVQGGSLGVAAYTIVNSIILLTSMILIGLTQGMQPIIGYSYGAGSMVRLRETLIYTIQVGVLIGVVCMIAGFFFPDLIISVFNPSEELAQESARAVKIALIMSPLVGLQIVIVTFFQSIGKTKQSIFLSLSRQLLFLVPAAFILSRFFGLVGIWIAIPLSDFFAAVLAVILLVIQLRNFKEKRELLAK